MAQSQITILRLISCCITPEINTTCYTIFTIKGEVQSIQHVYCSTPNKVIKLITFNWVVASLNTASELFKYSDGTVISSESDISEL